MFGCFWGDSALYLIDKAPFNGSTWLRISSELTLSVLLFSTGISLILWNGLYTAEKVIIQWTLLTEACYFGVQFLGEVFFSSWEQWADSAEGRENGNWHLIFILPVIKGHLNLRKIDLSHFRILAGFNSKFFLHGLFLTHLFLCIYKFVSFFVLKCYVLWLLYDYCVIAIHL